VHGLVHVAEAARADLVQEAILAQDQSPRLALPEPPRLEAGQDALGDKRGGDDVGRLGWAEALGDLGELLLREKPALPEAVKESRAVHYSTSRTSGALRFVVPRLTPIDPMPVIRSEAAMCAPPRTLPTTAALAVNVTGAEGA